MCATVSVPSVHKPTRVGRKKLAGGNVSVTFTLTNTGSRPGAEVAQAYVGFPASNGEPPKQLKGYQKVFLQPGQGTVVTLTLDPHAFAYWQSGWVGSGNLVGALGVPVLDGSVDAPHTNGLSEGHEMLGAVVSLTGVLPLQVIVVRLHPPHVIVSVRV